MRMPSMSQKLPTLSWAAREGAADFETEFSEVEIAVDRLGTLGGLCIIAPYEAYEKADCVFINLISALLRMPGDMKF